MKHNYFIIHLTLFVSVYTGNDIFIPEKRMAIVKYAHVVLVMNLNKNYGAPFC